MRLSYNTGRASEGAGLGAALGPLELAVMDSVWARGDGAVTGRQVYEVLALRRDIVYTTVMVTMGRLVDKGLLTRKSFSGRGAPCSYNAVYGRTELRAMVASQVLASLRANFGDVIVL